MLNNCCTNLWHPCLDRGNSPIMNYTSLMTVLSSVDDIGAGAAKIKSLLKGVVKRY